MLNLYKLTILFFSFFITINIFASSRVIATRSQIKSIDFRLKAFRNEYGRYPPRSNWYIELSGSSNAIINTKRIAFIDATPLDAWGRPFNVTIPGIHNTNSTDVYSLGKDGISTSNGNDLDDINNWEKNPDKQLTFEEIRPLIRIGAILRSDRNNYYPRINRRARRVGDLITVELNEKKQKLYLIDAGRDFIKVKWRGQEYKIEYTHWLNTESVEISQKDKKHIRLLLNLLNSKKGEKRIEAKKGLESHKNFKAVLNLGIETIKQNNDPIVGEEIKKILRYIVIEKIINEKFANQGFLGVVLGHDFTDVEIGDKKVSGILVRRVLLDYPAIKNGILRGDYILKVDNKVCGENFDINNLVAYISSKSSGDKIKILLWSKNKKVSKEINLEERPDFLHKVNQYWKDWLRMNLGNEYIEDSKIE